MGCQVVALYSEFEQINQGELGGGGLGTVQVARG